MSLFDGEPYRAAYGGVCILDTKGRAVRRRPWWVDLGKGPANQTCGTCKYLVKTSHCAGTYFKCGLQPMTGGPGPWLHQG